MNAHVNMKPIVNSCFVIAFFFFVTKLLPALSPANSNRQTGRFHLPTPSSSHQTQPDSKPSQREALPARPLPERRGTTGKNTPGETTSGGRRHDRQKHARRDHFRSGEARPGRNTPKGKPGQGNHQGKHLAEEPVHGHQEKTGHGDRTTETRLGAPQRRPPESIPKETGEHFARIPRSPAEGARQPACLTGYSELCFLPPIAQVNTFHAFHGHLRKRKGWLYAIQRSFAGGVPLYPRWKVGTVSQYHRHLPRGKSCGIVHPNIAPN